MCYIVCSILYSPTYPHNAVKAIVIVMVHSLSISFLHLQTRYYQMIKYFPLVSLHYIGSRLYRFRLCTTILLIDHL